MVSQRTGNSVGVIRLDLSWHVIRSPVTLTRHLEAPGLGHIGCLLEFTMLVASPWALGR